VLSNSSFLYCEAPHSAEHRITFHHHRESYSHLFAIFYPFPFFPHSFYMTGLVTSVHPLLNCLFVEGNSEPFLFSPFQITSLFFDIPPLFRFSWFSFPLLMIFILFRSSPVCKLLIALLFFCCSPPFSYSVDRVCKLFRNILSDRIALLVDPFSPPLSCLIRPDPLGFSRYPREVHFPFFFRSGPYFSPPWLGRIASAVPLCYALPLSGWVS